MTIGFITYLRTAAEIKSLLGLGSKKMMAKLKSGNVRVRLKIFMNYFFREKIKDRHYFNKVNKRLIDWQMQNDDEGLQSSVLLYHHTGARVLHGFRYELISYQKKNRAVYQVERRSFSKNERVKWLKDISTTHEYELKAAGFTSEQLSAMKIKGLSPAGYEVHHRIPLDDGGTNESSNLILIKNDVEHRSIHGYYNVGELKIKTLSEGESAEVVLPLPPKNAIVYPNEMSGLISEKIPNSRLAELYHVD